MTDGLFKERDLGLRYGQLRFGTKQRLGLLFVSPLLPSLDADKQNTHTRTHTILTPPYLGHHACVFWLSNALTYFCCCRLTHTHTLTYTHIPFLMFTTYLEVCY